MTEEKKHSEYKKFTSWLKASATTKKGTGREYMEDRVLLTKIPYKSSDVDQMYYVFLLLDGHGGSEVVDFTKQYFTPTFTKYMKRYEGQSSLMSKIISKTFLKLHDCVEQLDLSSGTTASLLLIQHDKKTAAVHTWLANVGDSTVYGIKPPKNNNKNNTTKPIIRKLSLDHSVQQKSEHKRVIESKAYDYTVEDNYICTENGHMLAMTRSIGDCSFGDGVTAQPTVKQIRAGYSIYVLASDGIWDVMDGKQVWHQIKSKKNRHDYKHSAYRFNEWRNREYDQHDNTSVIIVYLDWDKIDKLTTHKKSDEKNKKNLNHKKSPQKRTST